MNLEPERNNESDIPLRPVQLLVGAYETRLKPFAFSLVFPRPSFLCFCPVSFFFKIIAQFIDVNVGAA